MNEADALIALAHVVEPGDKHAGALVEQLGPIEVVERITAGRTGLRTSDELQLRMRGVHVDSARESADRLGARIVTRDDGAWPGQLDDLGVLRPYAMWLMGAADLRLTALNSIAVVGTRNATSYGIHVTRDWCSAFVEHGLTVVSGGAFGIDAAAHRAVLAAEGMTICVLASGVDVAYPRSHESLIARIADDGLVLSEAPLGEQVRRHRFLTRNRLIAALSRGTLIVESSLRSGTTSTANHAFGINRFVMAVPGPVTSPASAGCHHLIAERTAILAAHPGAVIDAARGFGTAEAPQPQQLPLDDLPFSAAVVLDAFPPRGTFTEQGIAVRAAVPLRDVVSALGHLSVRGLVERCADGWQLTGRA